MNDRTTLESEIGIEPANIRAVADLIASCGDTQSLLQHTLTEAAFGIQRAADRARDALGKLEAIARGGS